MRNGSSVIRARSATCSCHQRAARLRGTRDVSREPRIALAHGAGRVRGCRPDGQSAVERQRVGKVVRRSLSSAATDPGGPAPPSCGRSPPSPEPPDGRPATAPSRRSARSSRPGDVRKTVAIRSGCCRRKRTRSAPSGSRRSPRAVGRAGERNAGITIERDPDAGVEQAHAEVDVRSARAVRYPSSNARRPQQCCRCRGVGERAVAGISDLAEFGRAGDHGSGATMACPSPRGLLMERRTARGAPRRRRDRASQWQFERLGRHQGALVDQPDHLAASGGDSRVPDRADELPSRSVPPGGSPESARDSRLAPRLRRPPSRPARPLRRRRVTPK